MYEYIIGIIVVIFVLIYDVFLLSYAFKMAKSMEKKPALFVKIFITSVVVLSFVSGFIYIPYALLRIFL